MVDGEIIVVPQDPATLTTESDATSSILLGTTKREKLANEPAYIDNIEESPELPFHMIPQEQVMRTLDSGMCTVSIFCFK